MAQQPGTPAYCTELTAEELRRALATATKDVAPKNRDSLMEVFLTTAAPLSHQDVIAMNRKGTIAMNVGPRKLGSAYGI